MTKYRIAVLYTTVKDNVNASNIAKSLLKKKLIACANIFPSGQSVYSWSGEICCEEEVFMILKTSQDLVKKAANELKKIHPYDVPCIFEISVPEVHNQSYLHWILQTLS